MLDGLERKLVAVVGDAIAGLNHLAAVQLAGPGDEPAAGQGVVRLAVDGVTADAGFDRDVIAVTGTPAAPVSRRVLPLRFTAAAHFTVRPAGPAAAQRTAARTLLLGDVSAVGHALAAPTFLDGSGFATAGDAGFVVKSFTLAGGELDESTDDDETLLQATLRWEGRAAVWPTTPPQPEGVMASIDIELVPTPLALSALEPVVRQGSSTMITIDGVAGRRTTSLDPAADEPLALAITVRSDLPTADRGRVEGGDAGAIAAVRIVPLAGSSTSVTYRAPTGSLGTTSVEVVVVHLATPDGDLGVFLDSIPIRLVPAP